MSGKQPDDATVLRTDVSVSALREHEGAGEADAPRVLKQRFVLEEKLGSGGMGTVFRAKDLRKVEARDRQPYLAIKVLNNDFREHPEAFIALQREAAKSQVLSHPNIVSIYDFDKDGNVPFMTMELLEGQSLADLLLVYPGGLPDRLAWDVIRGLCAGLGHAHAGGIVHADFKPGNVYVAPSNAPKILDFGIARAVQLTEARDEDTLFDPGRLAALTPAYASREMLCGEEPQPADDLYSLGVVIYLILTGKHPYDRLSAEDAAKAGMKPERPRGIARRQWQVLARCLAFDRQDRPTGMAEVEAQLLEPSPWPVRVGLALVAVVFLGLSVNIAVEDAELNEVKKEVRRSTLYDAQRSRVDALLARPTFDAPWEGQLRTEYDAFANLDVARADTQALARRIAAAYSERVLATEDPREALGLLARGQMYGELPRAAAELERRALERIRVLLREPSPEPEWLATLAAETLLAEEAFPGSEGLAELARDVRSTLERLTADAVAAERVEDAERLLAAIEPESADDARVGELNGALAQARTREEARRREAERERQRSAELAAVDAALAGSCLRLDLSGLAMVGAEALERPAVRKRVTSRLSDCLVELAEIDPDRAVSLRREVDRRLGAGFAGEAVMLDPCGLSYLVGNGGRAGRQGYCTDQISDAGSGPRLVVLASADGARRFAIMKQEVSWAQLETFCAAEHDCSAAEIGSAAADPTLPVSGVSLATAEAYARWLSRATGYTYRLPTRDEWLLAADGEPDPNRNCRVRLDGVERGLLPVAAGAGQGNEHGLLNVLGNIQEWVLDGEELLAMGGSFSDPIAECIATTARAHDGRPAMDTGFRLVREVS